MTPTPPNAPTEASLIALLKERFGYDGFRRGQLDILLSVLSGRDTLAVMPTGGGKSLCYQIPAVYREGIVIVISPLISLMKDQVESLRRFGLSAGALHSGQELDEKRTVFQGLAKAKHFVLYLSPERVQKPGFAEWIRSQRITLFAIDEAHCVSSWGPEFRQDYHRLELLRQLRPDVPILALTATATPPVLRDIAHQLSLKDPARHVYGFYRPNLYSQVEICEDSDAKNRILREALRKTPEGRVIIYCGTRKQADELAQDFGHEFPGTSAYHAGMDSEARARVQQSYEDGKTRILAATNAFGMGIDHPDVRLVVHYQMPANIESYYQEMGRAGRDGNDSTCLLLYAKKDKGLHSHFIRQSTADAKTIDLRWRTLDAITQFAEGGECRHSGILTYFRDQQRIKSCGHCDVCAPESSRRVRMPKPEVKSILRKGSRREKVSSSAAVLTREGELRAELLREWRKTYADSLDIPAFLVFSNKTLHDLAVKNPRTLEDLAKVYGLGEKKIESFGPKILKELVTGRK